MFISTMNETANLFRQCVRDLESSKVRLLHLESRLCGLQISPNLLQFLLSPVPCLGILVLYVWQQ